MKCEATGDKGPRAASEWLVGGGEMGRCIRDLDWSQTPLGPRERWPQPLRTACSLVVESAFPMSLLWGPHLVLIYNDAYRAICAERHPGALGRSTRVVWPEAWSFNRPIFEAVLHRGETLYLEDQPFRLERGGVMRDAFFTISYSPVRMEDGSIGGALATLQETTGVVTRQREREREQADRLESVGRLAGGVAHEFNNLLLVILGYTELLLAGPHDAQTMEALREIAAAAERSTALTRQLLAFARKQLFVPRPMDLNELVKIQLPVLRGRVGEGVVVEWRPGGDLPKACGDPNHVASVLSTLCANARDAGATTITIETSSASLDAAWCEGHPDAVPGDYVALVVHDDGRGMDAQTLSVLFEPFLRLRAAGQGSGLGLPAVHGIVRQSKGAIHVESEPGRGTAFTIFWPRHVAPVEAPPRPGPAAPRARDMILLVEDDPAVLAYTAATIERLGYRVLPAATSADALRQLHERAGEVCVLVTCVDLPGTTGFELARQLKVEHPEIGCVFLSGYPASIQAGQERLGPFLQKPWTPQALAHVLRQAATPT